MQNKTPIFEKGVSQNMMQAKEEGAGGGHPTLHGIKYTITAIIIDIQGQEDTKLRLNK